MSPAIKKQAKLAGIALAAVMAFTAFGTGTIEAASRAETQCFEFCGDAGVFDFSKAGPTPTCICNETTKPVRGNAFGTATQNEESGHGNLNEKETGFDSFPKEDCTGNRGQCKQQ